MSRSRRHVRAPHASHACPRRKELVLCSALFLHPTRHMRALAAKSLSFAAPSFCTPRVTCVPSPQRACRARRHVLRLAASCGRTCGGIASGFPPHVLARREKIRPFVFCSPVLAPTSLHTLPDPRSATTRSCASGPPRTASSPRNQAIPWPALCPASDEAARWAWLCPT